MRNPLPPGRPASSTPTLFRRCLPAAGLLLFVAPAAHADAGASLQGSIESIEAGQWRVSGLTARVELRDDGLRGDVRIAELGIPAADLEFTDIGIECRQLRLTNLHFRCDDGLLTALFPGIGRHTVAVQFDYESRTGVTRFTLPQMPVAGSTARVQGVNTEADTVIEFDAQALHIDALVGLAKELGLGPDDVSASGLVSASGTLNSTTNGSTTLSIAALLDGASLSNASGTAVAESLRGNLRVTVVQSGAGWGFDIDSVLEQGEVYVEPVYANLSENAVRFRATDVSSADLASFRVPQLHVEQESLITLDGDLQIDLPQGADGTPRIDGRIDFSNTSVDAVYTGLLQVLAAGTVLGELETDGRFEGHVTFAANTPQSADITLYDVALDDRQRRFAIYGLDGTVHWPGPDAEASAAEPSSLRWTSAAAYSIEIGGGEIRLRLGGDDVELLQPLRIPTMGGALLINRLAMHNYGRDDASGLLDAELEPVQLGQLTGAFGWPAFSGSLSGRLPLLQYEGNAMTVGGQLTARAFDGDIEVANLRLEQPFGRVPRLYGDVRLKRLDLERFTDTFSFGLIQGRLSGDVTGLQMYDWEPVAMDLHVYTPPDDKSRHRISQRAVENLASVGGGGGAALALSSGFLKFFEVFAYDRIGLRCVLKDGICAMSGAGAAGEGPEGKGYYIVKGSGLPRIDVIGYRSRVSWQSLLQQLTSITQSEGPVVN